VRQVFFCSAIPASRCVFDKGKLTIFQYTSIPFWYKLAKRFADDISRRLKVVTDKVETIGSKKDSAGGQGGGGYNAAIAPVMKEF
jgi:hypothetical protein